jgi:hypothetical protein
LLPGELFVEMLVVDNRKSINHASRPVEKLNEQKTSLLQ